MVAASLFGSQAFAQFNVTTGVQNFPAGSNFLDAWYFDVDFGATPQDVTLSIGATLSTNNGMVVVLQDITHGAKATNFTEWGQSRVGPQVNGGPGTLPPTAVYGSGAVSGFPANLRMMSGICRFHFTVRPFTNPPTASHDITVNWSCPVGTLVGTIQVDNWTTQPPGGGTTTVGSSQAYQRNYSNQVLAIHTHGASVDEVQYNIDCVFPGTTGNDQISLAGLTQTGVTGQLNIALYDMDATGGSTPSIQITVANGAPAAATYTTPSLYTGLKRFRVVVRAGAGFGASPAYLINFYVTFPSGSTVQVANVLPSTAPPPMNMTPAGTTITATTTLNVTGGTVPPSYNWAIQGTTPTGVSLSGTTGSSVNLVISTVTPPPAGTQVTVRCSNGTTGEFAQQTYTINAPGGGLGITSPTTTALPNATINVAYTPVTFTAGGGTAPYSWGATGLPAGMTMTAGGVLQGTPTAAGNFNVQVTVTDSATPTPNTATGNYTLLVITPLTITSPTPGSTLANGTVGTAYTPVNFSATGGVPGYTWGVTGQPAGMTMTVAGVLQGTPTAGGSFTLTVTVTDSASPTPNTANATYSLQINVPALAITTPTPGSTLPPGTQGQPYSGGVTFQATGGTPSYSWSATGLPAGMGIGATTGTLVGTPSASGTFNVQVTVTDSATPTPQQVTENYTLVINAPGSPLQITSPAPGALPAGTQNVAYSPVTFTATGGTPPYSWGATGLPAGMTMTAGGVLQGTPTVNGSFNVQVTVTDSATPTPNTATANYTLLINIGGSTPLDITTSALPNGTVGVGYNFTVSATGGVPAYSWSAVGLPAGLSINPATGTISGTPTTAGTFPVTITVTDSDSPVNTDSQTFNITILPSGGGGGGIGGGGGGGGGGCAAGQGPALALLAIFTLGLVAWSRRRREA
ncbi:MAG: putative Ig domain-containing protein [Planctomycetes bacterium]|nr:putative Ig domain-containing protein [Planctomycetota bacterium]